ncbi:MAG: ABC transporter ATP-binding protein, partial [Candidatus Promineifilaceae bacterium]
IPDLKEQGFHGLKPKSRNLTFSIIHSAHVVNYMLGILIGSYLFQQGQITIGTVFLIVNYIAVINEPIQQLRIQIKTLQSATASIHRLQELFTVKNSVTSGSEKLMFKDKPSVTFKNVSFGYNESETVLHDVSFTVKPGQKLGLVGRTGSGKTTISKLLFRLYDPDEGEVQLDGRDIRTFELHNLRRSIGLVTQEVEIFEATVRDNVTFFNREISDGQILTAFEQLNLTPWFLKLPNGLDTQLTADGHTLSAGEAQLLAFTRVFLQNPKIVILDEASSRLDLLTEHLISHAIQALLHNRTSIIIAHRLKTLAHVDNILILANGKTLEYGPYSELANDEQSHFSTLLHTALREERI